MATYMKHSLKFNNSLIAAISAMAILPSTSIAGTTLDIRQTASSVFMHGNESRQMSIYLKNKASYDAMLEKAVTMNEKGKLRAVNYYFNQMPYLSDSSGWGKPDYWSTIDELLYNGKGDCEDLATAKYFTLKKLNIDESKLSLGYALYKPSKQGHLVVTYKATPSSESIILDSLSSDIVKKSQAKSIAIVYEFNESNTWIEAKDGKITTAPKGNEKWDNLVDRYDKIKSGGIQYSFLRTAPEGEMIASISMSR